MPHPHLRLLLADRCNLDCAYCHFQASKAGRDLMSPAVAREAIQSFAAAASRRGDRHADLSLYGGEPLLNRAAVEAALDEVEAQRAGGFELSPILNTNGTLITADVAARLARAGVDLHVSLDGPSEAANARRVNYAGRPSWPAVEAGLQRAKEAGCSLQINSILTTQTAADLRALIEFVSTLGCRRIFMALPDGSLDASAMAARARMLLTARSYARRLDVEFIGPWGVGLRDSTAPVTWPPLNVVVRPTGAAFFPYVPHRPFPSVATALSGDGVVPLEADWTRVVSDCASCVLHEQCQGYLKMMTRYHTGDTVHAEPECVTAREVARLALDDNGDYEEVRTTLDLRMTALPSGELEIANALIPSSALIVSRDVVDVLDWFSNGSTYAALATTVDAENLRTVYESLRARRLLVRSDQDTDVLLLDHLASPDGRVDLPPFRLGAAGATDLSRLRALAPRLLTALGGLPGRLARPSMRVSVFGARDRAAFAEVIGVDGSAEALDWMAATIFHSIIVLNLEACEALLARGGRATLAAFERGLVHELAHLGLRQAGLRVPVWLEEGLCEHLSDASADPERLSEAAVQLDDFRAFALACRSQVGSARAHDASLLEFSSRPIEVNPGYLLARDLVAFVANRFGLDSFLDGVYDGALRSLGDPFARLGRRLEDVLDAWVADVRARVSSRPGFARPLRILSRGEHAVLYNRMTGGYLTVRSDDPATLARIAGANLELEDLAPVLDAVGSSDPLVARWRSGVFPRKRGRHLRLALEDACNMGCGYCYEGSRPRRTMTVDVADRAVAAWRDLLEPGDLPRSSIRFFGGEPLLNWPVMKHVLDTAASGLHPEPRWLVNTNGTLLTDEHVDAFTRKGDRVLVAVSLDGVGATHDRLRVLKSGRGTFERVDSAANRLAASRVPLSLSAVVGDHNRHGLLALAQYAVDLRNRHQGPIALSLEPIIEAGGDERRGQELLRIYEEVLTFCRREGLAVSGKLFYALDALDDEDGASGHFCAVTNSELSVGPGGELVVCHAVSNRPYGTVDDVARGHRVSLPLWAQGRSAGHVDGCEGCEIEGLCGGGCTAQSVRATGRARGNPGPVFCTLMRGVFRWGMQDLLSHA